MCKHTTQLHDSAERVVAHEFARLVVTSQGRGAVWKQRAVQRGSPHAWQSPGGQLRTLQPVGGDTLANRSAARQELELLCPQWPGRGAGPRQWWASRRPRREAPCRLEVVPQQLVHLLEVVALRAKDVRLLHHLPELRRRGTELLVKERNALLEQRDVSLRIAELRRLLRLVLENVLRASGLVQGLGEGLLEARILTCELVRPLLRRLNRIGVVCSLALERLQPLRQRGQIILQSRLLDEQLADARLRGTCSLRLGSGLTLQQIGAPRRHGQSVLRAQELLRSLLRGASGLQLPRPVVLERINLALECFHTARRFSQVLLQARLLPQQLAGAQLRGALCLGAASALALQRLITPRHRGQGLL
mmetsp:Transcript_18319/g.50234  ORF Transcript_18319/g.50234 Transcript_18319/m.50234 type:complete len:362 (-) Transcript_18319:376-1461(-)